MTACIQSIVARVRYTVPLVLGLFIVLCALPVDALAVTRGLTVELRESEASGAASTGKIQLYGSSHGQGHRQQGLEHWHRQYAQSPDLLRTAK